MVCRGEVALIVAQKDSCGAAQGRDVCAYGHYGVGDNPFGADSSQAVFQSGSAD